MPTKTAALRDWIDDEGTPLARRALILAGPMGSPVAYVGVPSGHDLAGKSYDDIPLECHGGLTFADEGGRGNWPAGWYWYGWDYAHSGDFMSFAPKLGGHRWTIEEVEAETRKVMDQLGILISESIAD